MMVERLFLAVPRGCLQFVIVVFPDHTHLLFIIITFVFIKFCYHCSANVIVVHLNVLLTFYDSVEFNKIFLIDCHI